MRELEMTYGRRTYDEWHEKKPSNLRATRTSPAQADEAVWPVSSFTNLLEHVAFLGSMNKQLTLFYRGQIVDVPPTPAFFRDSWKCFCCDCRFAINSQNRLGYWNALSEIGRRVHAICAELGLPRSRGFRDIREIQWAVIQHYGLWPTPLVDLTSSLRVAATFAMAFQRGSLRAPRRGFVYVVAMPHSTGSITFDIDQHIVLARLHSACPPIARRPHYQNGFLVGHFPIYRPEERHAERSSLRRRLVAKFELEDTGSFWDDDFPIMTRTALMPSDDALAVRLERDFGPNAPGLSIHKRAEDTSGDHQS